MAVKTHEKEFISWSSVCLSGNPFGDPIIEPKTQLEKYFRYDPIYIVWYDVDISMQIALWSFRH